MAENQTRIVRLAQEGKAIGFESTIFLPGKNAQDITEILRWVTQNMDFTDLFQ